MTVVKCDKHPANYCVIFDGSEVLSQFLILLWVLAPYASS
jgi:hypothetical protein